MTASIFGQFPDPKFVIIGGPNGSGKTTLTRELLHGGQFNMKALNADDRAAKLVADDPTIENAPLLAAQSVDAELDQCIANRESVLVETVLSSGKYHSRVFAAQRKKMFVLFIFITLENPDLNIARVEQRVREAGHDVPADKIVERYHKSVGEAWGFFAKEADASIFYDNTHQPEVLLTIHHKRIEFANEARAKQVVPDINRKLAWHRDLDQFSN